MWLLSIFFTALIFSDSILLRQHLLHCAVVDRIVMQNRFRYVYPCWCIFPAFVLFQQHSFHDTRGVGQVPNISFAFSDAYEQLRPPVEYAVLK